MAHFDESGADGNSLLAVEKDRSSFGLGGGCHYVADGLTFGEYRSVWSGSRPDLRWLWIVTQVVVACSATTRFGVN